MLQYNSRPYRHYNLHYLVPSLGLLVTTLFWCRHSILLLVKFNKSEGMESTCDMDIDITDNMINWIEDLQ